MTSFNFHPGKIGIDQTIPGTTNAIVNKDISGNEIFTIINPAYTQQVGNILQEQLTETNAIANVLTFSTIPLGISCFL